MRKMKQEQNKSKFYFDWTDKSSGFFYALKEIIISKKSNYQQIDLVVLEEVGLTLILDGKVQIAELDEFIYHEVITHIPAITVGKVENVLIVGGGDGCALREILKYDTLKRCVLVDIDRDVVEISKEYLNHINRGAFFDPRVEVIFEDGRKFLERTSEKFDVIIIDTVDPLEYGPSYLLFTKEFMEVVKSRLEDNGIVAIQSNTIFLGGSKFLLAMYKTLERVFPKVSFAWTYLKSFMLSWAFTFGCKGRTPEEVPYEEIEKVLKKIDTRYLTPEVFRACIAKPKFFIEDIKKFEEIITDSNPVFVY
ncbi:Polyamine aminopropyltransferase [bacterium HR19]|nr:Polyamine aminopropyltransferase [bacterium HR19]